MVQGMRQLQNIRTGRQYYKGGGDATDQDLSWFNPTLVRDQRERSG